MFDLLLITNHQGMESVKDLSKCSVGFESKMLAAGTLSPLSCKVGLQHSPRLHITLEMMKISSFLPKQYLKIVPEWIFVHKIIVLN